jgi:hypothetical protein
MWQPSPLTGVGPKSSCAWHSRIISPLSAQAVDAARDKHATRQRMAAEGLPTPRNFLVTSPDQLKEVSQRRT